MKVLETYIDTIPFQNNYNQYKSGHVEIFVNPSRSELHSIKSNRYGVRGYLTNDGDLYAWTGLLLHLPGLKALNNAGILRFSNPSSFDDRVSLIGVPVIIIGTDVFIGESVQYDDREKNLVEKYMDRAKRKNRSLNFHAEQEGGLSERFILRQGLRLFLEKDLNQPYRTPGKSKKFAVKVKNPKTGNIKTVRFGDPNLSIKRDNPERRKSFRARHKCDNPGPKTKAKYWACKTWEKNKKVSDVVK